MADPEFTECQACAAKPGSPTMCTSCLNNREAISLLLGVLEAAEDIEGPAHYIHKNLTPAVRKLHRAIRKAKGMS